MKDQANSLLNALEQIFQSQPERPALETAQGILTYADLNQLTDKLSNVFYKTTEVGEFIGIEAAKDAYAIVAMIAALRAKRPFVMIDPRDSKTSNQKKVKLLRVNVLAVKGNKFGEVELSNTLKYLSPSESTVQCVRDDLIPFSSSIIYAIYTSGSTGEPKCVLIEKGPLAPVIYDHVKKLELSVKSRTLQFARLTFDGCITEILWTITSGACLIILDEHYLMPGETLQTTLEEFKITHLKTTPFALTMTKPTVKMVIQHVINGGGACRQAMIKAWSKFASFHNAYGTTETTVCNLLTTPLNPEECFDGIPMGDIVGDCEYELVPRNNNNSQIASRKGELVITGSSVALGYLSEEKLTRFLDDNNLPKYFTGDIVEHRGEHLYFIERRDRQLKIRGYRIDPGEIESVACRLTSVSEAVAMASSYESNTDNLSDEALIFHYVGEIDQKALRRYLEAELDSYKVPSIFNKVREFPYTKNGKVDREALKQMTSTSSNNKKENTCDHPIIELTKTLTGVQDVSEEDNFIDVGGDSASTLVLIAKLKELGWTDVGVKDIFQASSLKTLINQLSTREEASSCVV